MGVSSTDPNRTSLQYSSSSDQPQSTSVAGGLAKAATDAMAKGASPDDAVMDFLNQALGIPSQSSGQSGDNGLLSIPDGEQSDSSLQFSPDLFGDSSTSTTSLNGSRDLSDPTLSPGASERSQSIDSLYPSSAPAMTDINQGTLGDCYVLAPLASMASTPQGQALLQQAIEPVQSQPPSYDVHLYDPNGKPVTISVDGSTVNNGVTGAKGETNWSAVMEKAWAKYNDKYNITQDEGQSSARGYAGIGSGGFSSDIYAALTGKPAVYSAEFHDDNGGSAADPKEVGAQLKQQLEQGQYVTAYSNLGPANGVEGQDPIARTAGGTDVIGGHAYTVLGTDGDDVILRNPWGKNGSASAGADQTPPGVFRMSLSEFAKDFRYTIASGS